MNNQKDFSEEERSNRINLAACYHLADHFQMSDIIWNHITSKTSKDKNTFLINRFGLRYDEVTASNLIEIDLNGKIVNGEGDINYTGFVIHGAIHKAKENIHLGKFYFLPAIQHCQFHGFAFALHNEYLIHRDHVPAGLQLIFPFYAPQQQKYH